MVATTWISLRSPLREAGPQRPVGQPAGQNRVLAGPALPPEERAGNLAGRVHPLLDVDGQREEIEVLTRVLGDGGRRQHHGVVVERHHRRTGRLPRQPPGLEADGAGAERAVVQHRLGCDDVRTLHRVVLLLVRQAGPPGRPGRRVRCRCSVEAFGRPGSVLAAEVAAARPTAACPPRKPPPRTGGSRRRGLSRGILAPSGAIAAARQKGAAPAGFRSRHDYRRRPSRSTSDR